MNNLNCEELANINGGGKIIWYVIGGLALLVIGIIDGVINPKKCNNS